MLSNVRTCNEDERLRIVTNGGELSYYQIGDLKLLLIQVYYNKKLIANVISLKKVGDIPGVKVIMDTSDEKAIKVFIKTRN